MQVAALVRAVSLGQGPRGIHAMFEVLGDRRELAGVHRLRGFEEVAFFGSHRFGADVLGGPSDDRDMLVAEVAPRKRFFGLGQALELLADLNPLGGGASRQLAFPLQPGDDAQRAVGSVLTGFVEPAHPGCEGRLQRVDSDFADLDQQLAEVRPLGLLSASQYDFDGGLQLVGSRLCWACPQLDQVARSGHASMMKPGFDSYVSVTQRFVGLAYSQKFRCFRPRHTAVKLGC